MELEWTPKPSRVKFPFAFHVGSERHCSVSAGQLNWVGCGTCLAIGGWGEGRAHAGRGRESGSVEQKEQRKLEEREMREKEGQAWRKAEMRVGTDRQLREPEIAA